MRDDYKKILITGMLITCFYAFTFSIMNIVKWEKDNRKTDEITNSIKENVIITEEISDNSILINPDSNPNSLYWQLINKNFLNVDISKLVNENPDVVGWIKVNGTNIDYPFVHTKNNTYYLNHNINKKYSDAGWIFLDYRNDANLLDKNNIIYGHSRLDKTMFGSLKNTLKKSWFDNKENHVIKISTVNENTLWQVFSIYHVTTDPYYITTNFTDDMDFKKYINKSLNNSIYNFDAKVDNFDTILTLSTCYGDNRKLVLHAKLIKKEIKNS